MADTAVTKTSTGDADRANRVGGDLDALTITAFVASTFVLSIGDYDDTRISNINFKPGTVTFTTDWATAIDAASQANVSKIKTTNTINNNKDVPTLSKIDKYGVYAEYLLTFASGLTKKESVYIPYVSEEAKIATLKTFLANPTNVAMLYFEGDPDSVVFVDCSKVKMKNY